MNRSELDPELHTDQFLHQCYLDQRNRTGEVKLTNATKEVLGSLSKQRENLINEWF